MRGPVSESNEHPDDLEPEGPAAKPAAALGESEDDDEGAPLDDSDDDAEAPDDPDGLDDLDDLDALGIDGVVAQMTGGDGDEPRRSPRRRPVWVSAVVILACLYPLLSMWGDFRFWLRSGEPEPLGDAAALFEPGKPMPDLANR